MGTIGYWDIMLLGIFFFMFYEKLFFFISKLFYQDAYPDKIELLPLIAFIFLNPIISFLIDALIGFIIGKIKALNRM